jgi:ABC-type lipoprotein export system ATPase subunit
MRFVKSILIVYEGELVVLLGPSGSGKSTLLNILGGLDAPTSRQAAWRGHELVNASEAELTRYRREHVGYVFQFYNLIPSLDVLENVEPIREIADKPMDAGEALALVGSVTVWILSLRSSPVESSKQLQSRRMCCCATNLPALL